MRVLRTELYFDPREVVLLFLTIPAGIIVVGSAIAISNAIQSGLNHAIGRLSKEKHGHSGD
jgi:hypothetical protein